MKKLSTILILLGLIIILIPIGGKLYNQYKENKMINEWLEKSTVEVEAVATDVAPEEAYAELENAFSAEASESANVEQTGQNEQEQQSDQTTPKKKADQTVLGIISIKKIKCKYPIVEGVKEVNLSAGIGHITGSALPGQPGNCALAGHRNYTFGRFFNRLNEVENGDTINIITKNGTYKYVVYDKFTVTPDDVSVLKGDKDDNIITLITCTPIYVATHRLIVRARLESEPALDP